MSAWLYALAGLAVAVVLLALGAARAAGAARRAEQRWDEQRRAAECDGDDS